MMAAAARRVGFAPMSRGVNAAAALAGSRPAAVPLASVVTPGAAFAWSRVAGRRHANIFSKAVAEPDASAADAAPEPIKLLTSDESEELLKIRHTTAHICAMATQKLFPDAQCTIGPWYDLSVMPVFRPRFARSFLSIPHETWPPPAPPSARLTYPPPRAHPGSTAASTTISTTPRASLVRRHRCDSDSANTPRVAHARSLPPHPRRSCLDASVRERLDDSTSAHGRPLKKAVSPHLALAIRNLTEATPRFETPQTRT